MYEMEQASDYPGYDGPTVENGYLEGDEFIAEEDYDWGDEWWDDEDYSDEWICDCENCND